MIPKRLVWVGAVAAAVFASAGCSGDRVAPGEARLRAEGGVFVARGDGDGAFRAVSGTHTLRNGDRVRVRDGRAHIVTAAGAALEMATASELTMAKVPELVRGRLLVTTADKHVAVQVGPARATTTGIARLTRQLSSSVASYRGRTTVESVGRSLVVPALREATVPALGLLPSRPVPLSYDADDRWDRRFLAAAIEVGDQLEAVSRGIEAQIPADEGRTPVFYRTIVPALEGEREFDAVFPAGRDRGEILVGAAIAVTGREGSFGKRWVSTFSFRDEGAHWGLVVLDQKAMSTRLTDLLFTAVARTPVQLAAPAGAQDPRPAAAGEHDPGSSPPSPPGGPTPPPDDPIGTVPPVVPPEPPPGLLPPVVAPLTEPVEGLVGGLLGPAGGS